MEILVKRLKEMGKTLVFAESITGGLIASKITSIPGVSEVFWGSFVTYSNSAKERALGVNRETLDLYGPVSEEVCREMALGALKNSDAYYSLAITGFAGPEGERVGRVYIGISSRDGLLFIKEYSFSGDRNEIRKEAMFTALELLNDLI